MVGDRGFPGEGDGHRLHRLIVIQRRKHQPMKSFDTVGRIARIEGLPTADWVLIDAGDVIVHLFRPEVRSFYNLERMWAFGDAGTA